MVMKAAKMSFLWRVSELSLRDRVRSLDIRGVQSRASLLEVFQACPTGKRPWGKTKNMLERKHISSGLEMSWDPPGGAGGFC